MIIIINDNQIFIFVVYFNWSNCNYNLILYFPIDEINKIQTTSRRYCRVLYYYLSTEHFIEAQNRIPTLTQENNFCNIIVGFITLMVTSYIDTKSCYVIVSNPIKVRTAIQEYLGFYTTQTQFQN